MALPEGKRIFEISFKINIRVTFRAEGINRRKSSSRFIIGLITILIPPGVRMHLQQINPIDTITTEYTVPIFSTAKVSGRYYGLGK
ncbi:hypothetical protein TMatcc_004588 [Talaromyces marneffei ATCC 18224]